MGGAATRKAEVRSERGGISDFIIWAVRKEEVESEINVKKRLSKFHATSAIRELRQSGDKVCRQEKVLGDVSTGDGNLILWPRFGDEEERTKADRAIRLPEAFGKRKQEKILAAEREKQPSFSTCGEGNERKEGSPDQG